MSKTNLTTKNISEFKNGDSLYIQVGTSDFPSTESAPILQLDAGTPLSAASR